MNHHHHGIGFDVVTPFAVALASFPLAEVHQVAAIALTGLGCVYTLRKLWLSFKDTDTRTED